MQIFLRSFAAIAVTVIFSSAAIAETVAEWNFNTTSNIAAANVGDGTAHGFAAVLGGGFGPPTAIDAGSPNDISTVLVGGSPNNSYAARSAPLLAVDGGTSPSDQSFRVTADATGFRDMKVTWDYVQGYRANRFYQLQYTSGFVGNGDNASGTTWLDVPTGVGSSVTVAGVGTGTVGADGEIEIVMEDGLTMPSGTTSPGDFLFDLMYTFPSGFAGENNADFGVRFAAIHDPNGSDFVSSFAGTDSTDATAGYTRSTGDGGGTARYDLVRITGVPEPTSVALAGCGLALVGFVVRRRRK
ncbi:MAG: PEP-CTERM sorting domain-containing protein [Aeoliella sp.]